MPDLEALYREHRAGLVRLVERELNDHHDAEDVVQTAFLDAQRALERGTIPREPRAWLAAIALNAARGLRRRHVSVEALEEYAVQEASRLPEIRAALSGLPKNQQAAVVYRDLLGLSYAEMATQMGATVPAVTMLLHRARSRLREVLSVALPSVTRWKWLRGSPVHATAAKATGAVVLAGGLATAGVVAAQRVGRVAEPVGAGITTTAQQPRPNSSNGATKSSLVFGAPRRERRSRPRHPLRTGISPSAATQTAAPRAASAGLAVRPQAQTGGVVSIPAVSLATLSISPSRLPTPPLPGTIATIKTPVTTTAVSVPPAAGNGIPPGVSMTAPTQVATVIVSIP